MAAPVPRARRGLPDLVTPLTGPARVRQLRERHLPATQLGRPDRRAPPDHARASRSGGRRGQRRWRVGRLAPRRHRRRVGDVRRGAVHGRDRRAADRGPSRSAGTRASPSAASGRSRRSPIARASRSSRPRVAGRRASSRRAASPSSSAGRTRWFAAAPSSAALSADESLLVLEHADHGDLIHQALRVLIADRRGRRRATGRRQGAQCLRLVADRGRSTSGDRARAARRARAGDLGHVERARSRTSSCHGSRFTEVADWWPDGSAVLLVRAPGRPPRPPPLRPRRREDHDARRPARAARPAPGSAPTARSGTGSSAASTPASSSRWVATSRSSRRRADRRGRPFVPWEFPNPHGQTVHGWRIEPDGADGPVPGRP